MVQIGHCFSEVDKTYSAITRYLRKAARVVLLGWDSVKGSSVCRINYKIRIFIKFRFVAYLKLEGTSRVPVCSNPSPKADLIRSSCSEKLFCSISNTFKIGDFTASLCDCSSIWPLLLREMGNNKKKRHFHCSNLSVCFCAPPGRVHPGLLCILLPGSCLLGHHGGHWTHSSRSCTAKPHTGHGAPMWSHTCQREGAGEPSLDLLAALLLMAWGGVGFLCCKWVVITCVQLCIHQDHQLPSCRAASQSVPSSIVAGSYYIPEKRSHLLLLNLKVLVLAFFQPPQGSSQ